MSSKSTVMDKSYTDFLFEEQQRKTFTQDDCGLLFGKCNCEQPYIKNCRYLLEYKSEENQE